MEKGDTAPNFTLPSTQGEVSLSHLLGGNKKVVLAFYTEANTPSCAREVAAFKDEYASLQELDAEVVAVSADGLEAQRSFEEGMEGCPFPLASDTELETARAYGVVSEDGKRSRRAVFVVDEGGTILHAIPWYQPGNPAQFLEIFQALGLEG